MYPEILSSLCKTMMSMVDPNGTAMYRPKWGRCVLTQTGPLCVDPNGATILYAADLFPEWHANLSLYLVRHRQSMLLFFFSEHISNTWITIVIMYTNELCTILTFVCNMVTYLLASSLLYLYFFTIHVFIYLLHLFTSS